MQKRILSKKEIYEAGKFLETICRLDGNGFAAYDEDWSDQKVADKFGVSLVNIQDLRRQIIGHSRSKGLGGTPQIFQLQDKINKLDGEIGHKTVRIMELERKADDFEKRIHRLERSESDDSLKAMHHRLNGIVPRIVELENWVKEEQEADMQPYLTKGQGK